MNGLKSVLTMYLQKKSDWTPKGNLTAVTWFHKNSQKQYLPETVGRELRELETEKVIAVKPDGVSVQYKYIPEDIRERYITSSQRTDDKLFK